MLTHNLNQYHLQDNNGLLIYSPRYNRQNIRKTEALTIYIAIITNH